MTQLRDNIPSGRAVGPAETHRRRPGWGRFRFVVAALLLTAAVTKILNLPQILTGGGLLSTGPRLVSAIAFESAVGIWLMVDSRFRTWLLTLISFGGFAASSAYAIATDRSCDCFGEQVNTDTMLIVDIAVLVSTIVLRPSPRSKPAGKPVLRLSLILLLVGSCTTGALLRYEYFVDGQQARLLLVDQVLGRDWPLTQRSHEGLAELSTGRWLVLIARQDCDHCRELVHRYFTDPATHRSGERTALFVFRQGSDHWRFQLDRVSLDGEEDGVLNWSEGKPYVVNPAVFVLENGRVMDAAEGTAVDAFLGALFQSH